MLHGAVVVLRLKTRGNEPLSRIHKLPDEPPDCRVLPSYLITRAGETRRPCSQTKHVCLFWVLGYVRVHGPSTVHQARRKSQAWRPGESMRDDLKYRALPRLQISPASRRVTGAPSS
jgi:hypothetical protein